MENSQYSTRELDHYFKDMKDTVAEMNFDLKEIKSQTTKTNGRVTSLEYKEKFFIWTLRSLWILIILLIPFFIWFARQQTRLIVDEKIREALLITK